MLNVESAMSGGIMGSAAKEVRMANMIKRERAARRATKRANRCTWSGLTFHFFYRDVVSISYLFEHLLDAYL